MLEGVGVGDDTLGVSGDSDPEGYVRVSKVELKHTYLMQRNREDLEIGICHSVLAEYGKVVSLGHLDIATWLL